MQIEIYQADFKAEFSAIQYVRETVFVQEQNIPLDMEWDEFDAQAIHVVAKIHDQAVGTARLLHDGSIGRVAVLKSWRKQGIGHEMMRYLMNLAKQQQHSNVHLHAQVASLDFYQKLGFITTGDTFDEVGILHQMVIYHF